MGTCIDNKAYYYFLYLSDQFLLLFTLLVWTEIFGFIFYCKGCYTLYLENNSEGFQKAESEESKEETKSEVDNEKPKETVTEVAPEKLKEETRAAENSPFCLLS